MSSEQINSIVAIYTRGGDDDYIGAGGFDAICSLKPDEYLNTESHELAPTERACHGQSEVLNPVCAGNCPFAQDALRKAADNVIGNTPQIVACILYDGKHHKSDEIAQLLNVAETALPYSLICIHKSPN